MSDAPLPFGLPDEHYAAVGRVAAQWALLELSIDEACAFLAGMDGETATCFTAQVIGPARKLDAWIALMSLKAPNEARLKAARKWAGDVLGQAERRNRIVHDPWISQGVPDEGYGTFNLPWSFGSFKFARKQAPHRLQVTARRKLVMEFVRMETEEVNAVESAITGLMVRLAAIMAEVWQERTGKTS